MSTTYAAYSEGNDKIPDFGRLAMDFGDTALEIERQEYKRKKDALDFQSDLVANNQDVFYASFENSGIKNLDIYNQKMAGLIKEKIEYANREFQNSDKSIEAQQRYQMQVAKLRGEVSQFKENVGGLITYGQKVTELGDKASAVMYDNISRINNMMQDGVPSIDQDGNMQNVSAGVDEDGNRINESIKFSEMSSLTAIHQKQDMYGFATDAVKKFGKDSRFIDSEGKVVVSTLLDRDGNLNDAARAIVVSDVNTGSDSDIIDIADQMDVGEPVRDEKGRLLNRKELVDAIAQREVEYATQLVTEMSKSDDLLYAEYTLKEREQTRKDKETYLKSQKNKKTVVEPTHYNSAEAGKIFKLGCAANAYPLIDNATIEGIYGAEGDDFDMIFDDGQRNKRITSEETKIIGKPVVTSYVRSEDGRDFAEMTIITEEYDPETGTTNEVRTSDIYTLRRPAADILRRKLGLSPASDVYDDPDRYNRKGNKSNKKTEETTKKEEVVTASSETSTKTKTVTIKDSLDILDKI